MIKISGKENLVVGGIFGCLIGALFFSFGGISNFLCEMLFWSFVCYVAVIYFEIVPSFAKKLIKKYSAVAYYLSWLAWVPLAVGCAMVMFLASLLFVDYDINELNNLLKTAKFVLSSLMAGILSVAYMKKKSVIGLVFKW